MKTNINLDDLEKALLDRAMALSEEYSDRAKRSYNHYIEDENERLRLREEREVMAAKMQAEQVYRRMVQNEELQSVKRVDRLRWQLMHQVIDDVYSHLKTLVTDQDRYLKLLTQLLKYSFHLIPSQHLVVEFNAPDRQWLQSQWQPLVDSLKTEKIITLSENHCTGIGGFIIYDKAFRIRLNNTFEGIIERTSEDIHQIIAEHLFAELSPIRSKINGR